MLHDDEGDNISIKNRSFCELTAQYWAWKNVDADYYGFFHYRRYLSFNPDDHSEDEWGNINFDSIDSDMIDRIKLYPDNMESIITQYDVITVRGRKLTADSSTGTVPADIHDEYRIPPFQHREDLDLVLSIIRKKYPAFVSAADAYMHSNIAYECNMFIMKKDIFKAYASWLFDILFEAEREIDTSQYDAAEYRVFGYLAERLCGIYITWLKMQKGIAAAELPKTLIRNTEPKEVTIKPYKDGAVTIVTSANNAFAPYLDVFLKSVLEHSSTDHTYDIVIL